MQVLVKNDEVEIEKTKQLLEDQFAIVSSLMNSYNTVHLIDLEENKSQQYVATRHVKALYLPSCSATEQMEFIVPRVVVKEQVEKALEFTDLRTLKLRMRDKKRIAEEFVGSKVGWFRATFVAVNTDKDDLPTRVLFITEVIEKEKKMVEQLIISSTIDPLTKFYNRTKYEEDIEKLKLKDTSNFVYISMDVNGLKTTNDTYGHDVGDELIKGAASCIRKCFGSNGKIYRIGGDEFVAMIYVDPLRLLDMRKDFDSQTLNYNGELVKSISVSCGFVSHREFPDLPLSEIAKIADKRMYAMKALHYSSRGIDRRSQQMAYNALCNSYMKILKVDLVNDSFSIIQINEEDLTAESGYNDVFSTWVKNIAKVGTIYDEDVGLFLKKANLHNLRKYFEKGKKNKTFHYRRKIGGKFKLAMMEVVATQDYSPQNQTVFLYVKDLDA